jgi:hypothetical protein
MSAWLHEKHEKLWILWRVVHGKCKACKLTGKHAQKHAEKHFYSDAHFINMYVY